MTVTISIPDSTAPAPLYERYAGQSLPQRAYFEIDTRDGACRWGVSGQIGSGVPLDVWHRLVRRVSCDAALTIEQIVALTEEIRPLAERVVAGADTEWDGRNWVGTLSDGARNALDEIEGLLDPAWGGAEGEAVIWEAGEWLTASGLNSDECVLREAGLTVTSTDAEIRVAVEKFEAVALGDGIVLDGDLEDVYRRVIARVREDQREDAYTGD